MNEHPNGMCYVRTFVYVYDMCAKFSLLFPYVFALQRKFQFSIRKLCLFGWIFIFYCVCNFEIKVDRNVWKYTENIEIEHLKYGDCNLIWAIPDKVVH